MIWCDSLNWKRCFFNLLPVCTLIQLKGKIFFWGYYENIFSESICRNTYHSINLYVLEILAPNPIMKHLVRWKSDVFFCLKKKCGNLSKATRPLLPAEIVIKLALVVPIPSRNRYFVLLHYVEHLDMHVSPFCNVLNLAVRFIQRPSGKRRNVSPDLIDCTTYTARRMLLYDNRSMQ